LDERLTVDQGSRTGSAVLGLSDSDDTLVTESGAQLNQVPRSGSSVVPGMWFAIQLGLGAVMSEPWAAPWKVAASIALGSLYDDLPATEQPW